MADEPDRDRAKAAFSLALGTLYLVLGLLQLAAGLGLRGRWSELMLLGGGAPGGLALVIVGAVFLQGHRELRQGLREGVAFVYMGILLAIFFLVLELAEIGASYLGMLLVGGDDYTGYTALDSVTPALYLSPLALVGLWVWRGGFTLFPRGGVEAIRELSKAKEA